MDRINEDNKVAFDNLSVNVALHGLCLCLSNMLYLMIYLNHFIISVHGALTVMHMLLYLYA